MMRPIDADALRTAMLSYYDCVNEHSTKWNYSGDTLMDYEVADLIDNCIDNAPTLTLDDIVPHGRWEEYPDSAHLRCTHCKIEFKKEKMTDTKNYCPNCGAKMDLEEK